MAAAVFDARDPEVFRTAVTALADIPNKRRPTANNFAVAVAALAHRASAGRRWAIDEPPTPSLSSAELQSMCDAVWEKHEDFWPTSAEGPIFKPFEHSFKPRSTENNNWRSSFNLQAGLGCDAPFDEEFLRSETYVAENRFDCRFRDEDTMHCLAPRPGTTDAPKCFDPSKGQGGPPTIEAKDLAHPKLLARAFQASGRLDGYWLIPQNADSLIGLLASTTDRVPAYPFAAALYGGSDYWIADGGVDVTAERLAADLGLRDELFFALFDLSPRHPGNAAMFGAASAVGFSLPTERTSSGLTPPPPTLPGAMAPAQPAPTPPPAPPAASLAYSDLPTPQPVGVGDIDLEAIKVAAGALADPEERARLLERAVKGHQRALQLLIGTLSNAGYSCTQQSAGFDLAATHPRHGDHLFEVKTFTEGNLTKQIRSGWAQLYEYRFRNAGLWPAPPSLYLVFDHEPPAELWLWSWLQDDRGVTPCWIEDDGSLKTFDGWGPLLPPTF